MAFRAFNDQVDTTGERPPAKEPASGRPAPAPGCLLDLAPTYRQRVGERIRTAIESWEESSAEHMANLRRWNDLLEGVIEETDFPWEGASQLNIPLVALHINTLHSVISRSILTVDPFWFGKTLDKELREHIPDIEGTLTYKARSELNTVEAVRDVLFTTPRDGTGWLWTPWVEEYETTPDREVVRSVEEFTSAFPDPESAGMDQATYDARLEEVRTKASEDNPMEIPVVVDRLVYRGPKSEVVEEADMMRVPMTAKDLKGCRIYGRRISLRADELKGRVEDGAMWDDAVKKLLERGKTVTDASENAWKQNLNQIEGITNESKGRSDDYAMFEGVIKLDPKALGLPSDGRERKYFFSYSKESRRLLGLSDYIYRKDIATRFHFLKRPGRGLGKSIPELLEGLAAELNASIREDINSDTISAVPIFKGKRSAKEDFDPAAEENQIKPGVMFWLEDPNAFDIVNKSAAGHTFSVQRRQEIMRYAEMLVGPTQLLSGRESALDPNAPGNKTIALIQQSNMRIEDYINEFRIGFDELGELIQSHYYQFGPEEIEFESQDGMPKVVKRKLLRGDVKLSMHGVTASMSPEVEFGKAMMWFGILSKDPMVMSDPVRHRNLLNRLALAGRLEGRDELIPSKEEVQGEKDQKLKQEAKAELLADLIKKGLLPPPGLPGQPPAGLPGMIPGGGAPPMIPPPGPGMGVPSGSTGPGGLAGLPPINNLPPPGMG